jgi:hypothetical protein
MSPGQAGGQPGTLAYGVPSPFDFGLDPVGGGLLGTVNGPGMATVLTRVGP